MPLFLTSADACWSLPGIIIQTAVGRLFRPVAFGAPLANRNGAASNGFKDCLLSFLHFGFPLQHPRDKEKEDRLYSSYDSQRSILCCDGLFSDLV